MRLNAKQKQAVEYVDGPMLIVAGAGTGKTRVITEKIKWLVQQKKVDPQRILALTFTEKAAEEMVERLDEVMPYGYEEPWVCTFHKFGDRVLKEEGLEIGLDINFKILTRAQQYLLMKQNIFDFELKHYLPLGNPNRFIGALINVFSRAADEDVSVEEFEKFAKKLLRIAQTDVEREEAEKQMEVARAYEFYQKLKEKESVLDFGDLITKTLELFRTRKTILEKYGQKFKYVLVDEFQDTNFAQYQLVKLLVPSIEKPSLTVVGDDSQSIYRFRGAAISNIMNFMSDYPDARQVVLTDNYRSTQNILDGAYRLIKNNDPETLESKLGISKDLKSQRQMTSERSKETAVTVTCESEVDEVELVVHKIGELMKTNKYNYKDFAVLARANSQLEPYVTALKQLGLPYQRIGNRGLFEQDEVKFLIHLLKVVVDPQDSLSLFEVLYYPGFDIDKTKVLGFLRQARIGSVSLWEKMKGEPESESVIALIEEAQTQLVKRRPSKILFGLMEQIDYVKGLVINDSIQNQLKIKNINLFFRYIQGLERTSGVTLVGLMKELECLLEAGENPSQAEVEDIDAITLSTVHSAKGLEFGVVFMVSIVAGRFPTYTRRDPIELPNGALKEKLPEYDNTAEERRLFYVGMTRARDYLVLSHASDYGGVRKRKPSGFLKETGLREQASNIKTQLSLMPSESDVKQVQRKFKSFELRRVSYSQIDTFKACPLKYKYRYILRIPAEPHHAVSFGRTIHETLKEFHQLEMAGQDLNEKRLLKLYENNFINEGYESTQHKEKRYNSGKKALKVYFEKYKKQFANPWRLEQSFRLKIAGVIMVGKIDRIDKRGSKFEIVDYKTGSASKKDQVHKDEQLSIYALAAKEVLGVDAERLALYFLESGERVDTQRSDKQLSGKRKDLERLIEQMKTSAFEAKPGFVCGFCEYKKICQFAETS